MNKVVALRGGPAGPTEPEAPDETVIKILEEMLERAKTGEISAVALAYILPQHAVGTAWAGANFVGGGIALGFAITSLEHSYYAGMKE